MLRTKFRDKFLTKLISAACVVAFLAACVPATPAPVPTQAAPVPTAMPETVHLLTWSTSVHMPDEETRAFLADFNSTHPGVVVDYDPAMAGLDYQTAAMQKLKIAWLNGTGPDFTGDAGVQALMDVIKDGGLMDLTPAYEKYGWKDYWPQRIVDLKTVDGKLVSAPPIVSAIGIFYNKELYAKLGLSIPKTYDELLANMEAIKKAGYYPLEMGISQGWPAEFIFSELAFSTNGNDYIDVMKGNKKWTESESVRTAANAFNDLVKKGYFNPDPIAIDFTQGDQLFFQGKAAMTWNGYWLIGDWLRAEKPFELGFFPMPPLTSDAKPLLYGGAQDFVVNAHTKYPQQVLDYMNWFFSPETAVKVLRQTSAIVPIPFTVPDDLPSVTKEYAKFTLDNLKNLAGYEVDYLPAEMVTKLSQAVQGMVGGDLTPDQLLQEMQKAQDEHTQQGGN